MRPVSVSDVCEVLAGLGAEFRPTAHRTAGHVTGFARPEFAGEGDIAWMRGQPGACGATLVVSDRDVEPAHGSQIIVVHPRPREMLAGIIQTVWRAEALERPLIVRHAATVHPTGQIGVEGLNLLHDREFPAVGGVKVGGNGRACRIDAFATIARGTIVDTRIDAGACIGAHANIGHDAWVGEDAIVVAHASLAGWVKVGKRARIYQGALVKNGVTIGDGAIIGMGAVVLEDVPAGETWAGNPARRIRPQFAQGAGI